jgi:hypothetical protein
MTIGFSRRSVSFILANDRPMPGAKGESVMRMLGSAIFVIALVPVLLVVAIALGPVVVTLLFAAGCGLVVFVLWNIPIGLSVLGHSIEKSAKSHHSSHGSRQLQS